MSDDLIRIGAKNLALLTLEEQCRRCYWLALRVGFKGIWEKFGPLYTQLDAFIKNHVDAYIDEHDRAPEWMPMHDKIVRSLSAPRLRHTFQGSRVEVRGVPDGIYLLPKDRVIIVDFKTGKPKYPDHPWFNWYRAQLCAYGHMLELKYDYKVAGLYMVNAVVQADKAAAADVESRRDDGFVTRFRMEPVEVPCDFSVTPDLALAARRLYDLEQPPESHAKCKDCARLRAMLDTFEMAEASLDRMIDGPVMLPHYHYATPWQLRSLR